MPDKITTITPETPPEKPGDSKFDRYRPEMPQIPGLDQNSRASNGGSRGVDLQPLLQIAAIALAVALVGGAIYWFAMSKRHAAARSTPADSEVVEQAAPLPALPDSIAPVPDGPTVAAAVTELSKPWASKKFTYVDLVTHEKTDAMVIRLPGGELWAFSIQVPLGKCELQLVTDIPSIAAQYGYNATHPMVVNPCERTLYDPLKLGSLGGDTWVRGEIVQGSALRPPISIDVKVRGRSIVADKIE